MRIAMSLLTELLVSDLNKEPSHEQLTGKRGEIYLEKIVRTQSAENRVAS